MALQTAVLIGAATLSSTALLTLFESAEYHSLSRVISDAVENLLKSRKKNFLFVQNNFNRNFAPFP